MDGYQLAIEAANMAINTAMGAATMINENNQIDKQNQYNLDMWKMQNEYNSPQAQMQRYVDAGLNPNLIYSQGTSGNNASAPAKLAPDYQKGIDKIQQAFNIEGLMTADAERRIAEENARLTQLKRFDAEDMRDAQNRFGSMYSYDPESGRYVFTNPEVEVSRKNPRGSRRGDAPTTSYWFNDQFRKSESNWLNPFRQNLLQGQRDLLPYREALIRTQRDYLAPQVQMQHYNQRFYPWTFWIGNGTKLFNSVSSVLPRIF